MIPVELRPILTVAVLAWMALSFVAIAVMFTWSDKIQEDIDHKHLEERWQRLTAPRTEDE